MSKVQILRGIATLSFFANDVKAARNNVTRRISVNAQLFDDFDAATAPVVVIDGKNLW